MADPLKRLTIEGFKSIRKLDDFELRSLNVLIGANGAGKSNFVGFFRLLRELIERRLQTYVRHVEGGADACLYLGPKITPHLAASLQFGQNGYEFTLVPTPDSRFAFARESALFRGHLNPRFEDDLGSGHLEAKLKEFKDETGATADRSVASYVFESIASWVVYHFHDTSLSAPVRREQELNDNEVFRQDAGNLAPFLFRVRHSHPDCYTRIRDSVRLAAPFFDDFKLRPIPWDQNRIQLEWTQKGSDYPFRSNQLSDGTLRFICLVTALLQPHRPATVLFDEPELGLHPYALSLLGNLFKQAVVRRGQLIISTQSAPLLNEFEPEDVIVVERREGESTFRRLASEDLSEWLNDYTLGELWQKNVLGGRPREDRTLEPVHGADQPS